MEVKLNCFSYHYLHFYTYLSSLVYFVTIISYDICSADLNNQSCLYFKLSKHLRTILTTKISHNQYKTVC